MANQVAAQTFRPAAEKIIETRNCEWVFFNRFWLGSNTFGEEKSIHSYVVSNVRLVFEMGVMTSSFCNF